MTDRELIQKCIVDHWEPMRENRHCGEKPIATQCALCQKYLLDESIQGDEEKCVGCPIYKHTGRKYCKGTPYLKADKAFDEGTDEEWQEASTAMIEFLKALPEMGEV